MVMQSVKNPILMPKRTNGIQSGLWMLLDW